VKARFRLSPVGMLLKKRCSRICVFLNDQKDLRPYGSAEASGWSSALADGHFDLIAAVHQCLLRPTTSEYFRAEAEVRHLHSPASDIGGEADFVRSNLTRDSLV
jgi:hypothetical protein